MAKHELWELRSMQAAPLSVKISLTKQRIRDWVNHYGEDNVYVSFSGGKDSTVLLHLVREEYPDVKAMFVNTGLEFPEIVQFVKTFDNVDIIRPKMNFRQVIEKYGYPFISKEVSECVYGARKYLTSVLAEADALPTDRPTDRPTEHHYRYYLERLCGYGEYASTNRGGTTGSGENSEESASSRPCTRAIKADAETSPIRVRSGQNARTMQVWQAIQKCQKTGLGGVEQSETLQTSQESELINLALSTLGCGKTIDNLRVQRLMGINRMDGKATMETIPNARDRSMFSCERYQFFLDAPFEISNICCRVMKKAPAHSYHKQTGRCPMTAQMASESRLRTQVWTKHGCNAFDTKIPTSNPMAFWTEQDVLLYIKKNRIPICSVYGDIVEDTDGTDEVQGQLTFSDLEGFEDMEMFDARRLPLKTTGAQRTGCMFCGYGCHHDKSPSRFERLKVTHPKIYNYIFKPWDQGGLGYKEVIDWINEHGNLHIRY